MSRRSLVAAALLVGCFASFAVSAQAQERLALRDARVSFMPSDAVISAPAAGSDEPAPAIAPLPVIPKSTNRLLPLYVATGITQALDVHSTMQVLSHGGGEGNPMLQGLVGNRPAFIAAKAAIAASTMYAASRIAKHSRIGAVVTLVAINSAYAMVASHNYKLASSMR